MDVVLAELPPWDAATWQALTPFFAPLLDGAHGLCGVQTTQYENGKRVSIGRLGWDARSHARWALPAGSGRTFVSTEMWAPSRGRCARDGRPPAVFLHMFDRASVTGAFLPVILLAVALDADLADADHAIRAAAATLQAIHHGRTQRPWGRSSGGGFTDAIEDLGFSPNLTQTAPGRTPTLRGDHWERLPRDLPGTPFGQALHGRTDGAASLRH